VGKQIQALLRGRPTKPFKYRDKGTMATIGKYAAVAEIAHVPKMSGFIAWAIWLFVHIISLLGNRNRLATTVNLAGRYLAWPRTYNAIVGEVPTPEPGALSWAAARTPARSAGTPRATRPQETGDRIAERQGLLLRLSRGPCSSNGSSIEAPSHSSGIPRRRRACRPPVAAARTAS
jgi:hypothetical protein